MSTSPLTLAPAEYQASLVRLHRIEFYLPLVGILGILVSAGTSAYIITHPGFAWAAPLPFLATAVLLLVLLSQRFTTLSHLAEIRLQLGASQPEARNPYTPFLLRLMLLPLTAALLLFGLISYTSWQTLNTTSPLSSTLFAVVYLYLTLSTLLVAWAVRRQAMRLAPLTFTEVRQLILPYPAGLIVGLALVTAGWLAAWLTVGLNAVQIPLLISIFLGGSDTPATIPLSAVAALAFLAFVIIEGLLVPAGTLWRDLRALRATAADPHLINNGYAHVLVRLALAFPLAFWTGGYPLLVLALLIWLHMTVSALSTPASPSPLSPRAAAASARFSLLWAALLFSLRFYNGILVWTGPVWTFTVLLLLFCLVSFFTLGLNAAAQARRARRQVSLAVARGDQPAENEDPALAYALHSAPRWQRAGFLAAALTALVLVVLQALAENPAFFNDLLANGYGFMDRGALIYHPVSLVNSLLLLFDLLILGLLACAGIVRLFTTPTRGFWNLLAQRLRPLGMPLLVLLALVLLLMAFFTTRPGLAFDGLLLAILGAFLWAER